jgi:hypothetical protein
MESPSNQKDSRGQLKRPGYAKPLSNLSMDALEYREFELLDDDAKESIHSSEKHQRISEIERFSLNSMLQQKFDVKRRSIESPMRDGKITITNMSNYLKAHNESLPPEESPKVQYQESEFKTTEKFEQF